VTKQLLFLIAASAVFISCKSVHKNRTDDYVPANLQCPTDTDPSCVGASTAGVTVPLGSAPNAADTVSTEPGRPHKLKKNRYITGECQLVILGENQPRDCAGLRLQVRSTRDNEVRTAHVTGRGFKIDGLEDNTDYRIEALDDRYDLSLDQKPLRAGQKPKITVKAKPRL
jgi:hypothetical protein